MECSVTNALIPRLFLIQIPGCKWPQVACSLFCLPILGGEQRPSVVSRVLRRRGHVARSVCQGAGNRPQRRQCRGFPSCSLRAERSFAHPLSPHLGQRRLRGQRPCRLLAMRVKAVVTPGDRPAQPELALGRGHSAVPGTAEKELKSPLLTRIQTDLKQSHGVRNCCCRSDSSAVFGSTALKIRSD